MPSEEEKFLTYSNYQFEHPISYYIVTDFESCIRKLSSCEPNYNFSFTEKVAEHQACGYAYLIIGPGGKSEKPIQWYRGEGAIDHFFKTILKEKEDIALKLTSIKLIVMSPQEEHDFQSAKLCYLCKNPLGKNRVRDHDHGRGKYRGPFHSQCNLKYRLSKKIPKFSIT